MATDTKTLTVAQALAALDHAVTDISGQRVDPDQHWNYEAAKDALIAAVRAENTPKVDGHTIDVLTTMRHLVAYDGDNQFTRAIDDAVRALKTR